MDSNIRQLLSAAQQYGVQSEGSFLHQAYDQLKIAAETKPSSDGPLPFGQDLYVLCAEIAFQYGLVDITKECLKMFFMKTSPPNQFLCRAYLCQAQLLAPTSAEDNTQLDKAVVYLLKAINFAKENPRYHFLVYNASVLFWQFCRPFLKPHYRQYLSISLHSVVKVLDDIDDKDYEWRAQLMIALIECHVDAGRTKEAAEVSKATAEFTKSNVPALYKQVLGLQIRHQLVDHNRLLKDIKQNGDLIAYYKLVKLRVALEQKEVSDLDVQGDKLLRQILMEEDISRSSSSLSGRKTALSTPVSVSEDISKQLDSRGGAESPSPVSLTSVSKVATIVSDVPARTNKRTPAVPAPAPAAAAVAAPPQPDVAALPIEPVHAVAPLLLQLANLCVEYDQPDLVSRCLDGMKNTAIKDKGTFIQMEFIECSLMVLKMREKQESYSKASVEVRIQAISRLSEALMNAVRYDDPNIIQAGCVTQWNLCLPLLQANLRQRARKPLTLVAEALENIQSLLVLLRCQIHTELAKCEEDEEQIQVAMEHLRKALSLDDGGQYHERLETTLHRLQLRAELYKPPDSMEDQAAMIIEQARKSAESGTVRMKRSLLVKAGQALSPDAFLLVLESENEIKGGGGKGYQTIINQLGNRARHFQKCIKKCSGHIKRLGSDNERERARLWADLAKVARRQEVWDVCRVASRFSLLYDDDRWHMVRPSTGHSDTRNESILSGPTEQAETPTKSRKAASEPPPQEVHTVSHSDKDLIRTLAEIHFLNAESLIHLLRSEGVSLNDEPIPPVDKSKHPKGYIPTKPEDDPDWITYREWIKDLSDSITRGFLRASELGVQLNEPWIVCSSATYLWNYNNHLLSSGRHRELIGSFNSLLQDLKQVRHAGETIMLVNLCTALAYGLVQPWIPKTPAREVAPPPSPKGRGEKDQSPRKAKSVTSHTSAKTRSLTVDPDGLEDIKKALEVCEYAMEVTNGNKLLDVVPISVRHPLIIIWTRVKQLIGQQIAKSLGTEDENNSEGQRPLTRAMVALEMKALNGNGLLDFKETPPLAEICNMVEECDWQDCLVELQVWTRLSELALATRNHQLVIRATGKALEFNNSTIRSKKMDEHKTVVYNEMLSYSSRILGQSLMYNMQGKNTIRRSALEAFLNAARYGRKAKNYALVITAARLYWNGCLPLVNEPMERQLLKRPLTIILDCITTTTHKTVKKEDETSMTNGAPLPQPSAKGDSPTSSPTTSPIAGILSDPEDDLTLRVALYGVMFQAYVDQSEWEEALSAMDKAITDMPRTKHRLLIFKHRLIVKAKLGRDVSVDIAKFKDESEDYLSMMWHKVAVCSRDQHEQLTSYKNAIEALQASASDWQKVEYLMEFAEWMYVNEFPLMDCLDQLEWAADILLNMKIETRVKVTEQAASKPKKKKGRKSAEQAPHSPAAPHSPTPTETKTVTDKGTDSEGEDAKAARFIPIKKQSVIGLSASNLNLSASELTSVKQLEHLVRIHVMLARMAGRESPMHTSYCLLAWGFLIRIWQVSLGSASQVAKEMAKVSISNEQQGNQKALSAKGKAKKDGGGNKGGKEQETPRDKPKRKGPVDAVPLHPEDWAFYDVPDEMREAFKEDHTGEGINKDTITKPALTLYYLDSLVSELRGIGYSHLTFPALVLGDVITRDILDSSIAGNTYRLLSAEVCLELNLTSAAKFHEGCSGPLGVNEEDLARSREETSHFKERQNQVRVEAERTKELQRLMTGDEKLKKKSRTIIPADQKMDMIESVLGFSKSLSGMTYRQAWTYQAEILIKQGYYQSARQLLSEAHLSTKAFDDRQTEAQILLNLAKLAYQEANYGQAINLLQEAQKFEADESFWLDTTLLLINATLGDPEDKGRNNKARAIILKALSSYTGIADQRPNKKSQMIYIRSTLEAKYASIQISQVLEESKNTMKPKAHRELQAACQRLQSSADDFVKANFRREAVQVMQQQASVLRLFACDSDDKDIQHSFLLQAQSIMQKAVRMMDHLLRDVCTLSAVQEMRSISLPLQRECCVLKTSYAELLIDMFVIYAEEQRQHQMTEAKKGHVEKLVEDFISATPVLTDIDKQWQKVASTLATGALSLLESAHTLAGSIGKLKAKSLYNMGRCLRMLGDNCSPSPPNQWDIQYMNLMAVSGVSQTRKTADETEDGEAVHDGKDLDMSSSQQMQFSAMAENIKASQTSSELYMAQATEVLAQSVQLALQKGDRNLVAAGCLEIVESCGQYDPAMATQYLALYQSCTSSKCLEDLLLRSQRDPFTSKQAALLQQRQCLESDAISTNMSHSTLAKVVNTSLQENSEAWKRIAISPQHMDLIKELPTNFNVVILQHSEDKSTLYGSILDRPKPAGVKEGGKPSKGAQTTTSRAKITRTLVHPQSLESLHRRFRQHKQDVMATLLKAEYQRSQQAQRQKMLENISDDMKDVIKDWSGDIEKSEEKLQEEFLELLRELEEYLKPVLSDLEPAIRALETPAPAPTSRSDPATSGSPDECLILLADKWLLEMPLEALAIFSSPALTSLSRDFSLQMLYNRIHKEPEEEVMTDDKKKKEAAKIKAAKDKSKGVKMVPIDRPVPPCCLPIDTHSFKYVVDPHYDCPAEEAGNPIYELQESLKLYNNQFTARWEGLTGSDHVPSVGEWEEQFRECAAFIFYGLEKFFSHVPPQKVAPMNLSECQLVILLDLVQTNLSFMRQSKIDVQKSSNELSLEKSVETAMILSLSGAGCVMANQWHCTLQHNATKYQTLLKGLLEVGRTTGQTVRRMFIPTWKQEGEEEEGEGEGEDRHEGETSGGPSQPPPKANSGGSEGKGDKAKNAKNNKGGEEGGGKSAKVKGEEGKSAKGKARKEDKREEPVAEVKGQGSLSRVASRDQVAGSDELELISRHWFNFVCYGLPNLMVTQV